MRRILLFAVVIVLGVTPTPPEAPRPGQLLVDSSAAVESPPAPRLAVEVIPLVRMRPRLATPVRTLDLGHGRLPRALLERDRPPQAASLPLARRRSQGPPAVSPV
jgi:hypothetical protein